MIKTGMIKIAEVLVPLALDTAFSYSVPDGIAITPGDFVSVQFGNREIIGVVWVIRYGRDEKLKSLKSRCDIPPLSENLRKFLQRLADWTLAPRGMVVRMATHVALTNEPEPTRLGYRLTGHMPERLTRIRQRVVDCAKDGLARTKSELAELSGCSTGVIDALVASGTFESMPLPAFPAAFAPDVDFARTALNEEQELAAYAMKTALTANSFCVQLLDGVTGSGKTEVYFEAVAEAFNGDKQVLILMPEVALTGQFLDRFEKRFGVRPTQWHSGISPKRRARIWHGTSTNEVKVVIGTRSSLFLPFEHLGLIVVDEEHDGAYKQDGGVSYHARDMAILRAKIENFPIILASATPSLESLVNAARGRYQHLKLAQRYAARALPAIVAIDMRNHSCKPGQFLSEPLLEAIGQRLERGEQSLLFVNRRGYAPLTLCRKCGHRFQCPNCSAWLVEHRFRRALQCHHCGHLEKTPSQCPECKESESLAAVGPGVERLAEEIAQHFPHARRIVLSSDFPGGMERLRAEFQAIAEGRCDIVIGTQLVAKGHHFPHLTLVGIIDSDIGLTSGDPRAGERSFQLLQQVSGRAGRGEKPGTALLQSWQPDHPLIGALIAGDKEKFYALEFSMRQSAALPPFARLAALIISGTNQDETLHFARQLVKYVYEVLATSGWNLAPPGQWATKDELSILGPAEAPIALIAARYRYRFLLKAPRSYDLQGFIRQWMQQGPKPHGTIRVVVDIDPYNFL